MKNRLFFIFVLHGTFLSADMIQPSVTQNNIFERVDKEKAPMTVEELVGCGFNEEQAKKHVKMMEDLNKFKALFEKLLGPKESDEIRDEQFLKIINKIRQHKQLTENVKVYQDHDNKYLGNAGTAKTLVELPPLAPIILSNNFFNYPKSTQMWILYHEIQHVKQARGQAITCLSDSSVNDERDADLSAAREIDCCHCLSEVLANNYNIEISEYINNFVNLTEEQVNQIKEKLQQVIKDNNEQGYLTIEELKDIIKEKIYSGKHDMCTGHMKLLFSDWYFANNESEKLQDFVPNKAQHN